MVVFIVIILGTHIRKKIKARKIKARNGTLGLWVELPLLYHRWYPTAIVTTNLSHIGTLPGY